MRLRGESHEVPLMEDRVYGGWEPLSLLPAAQQDRIRKEWEADIPAAETDEGEEEEEEARRVGPASRRQRQGQHRGARAARPAAGAADDEGSDPRRDSF